MTRGVKMGIHAQDKTGRAFSSVNNRLNTLNKRMGGFSKRFGGIGATIATIFTGAFIKSVADAGDKINKLSIQLGETETNLSGLKFAAEQSGLNLNTLGNSAKTMQSNVSDAANGIGTARDSLDELGISAEKLEKLSIKDQFLILSDAISGVENSADKTRIAMDIFGGKGAEMIQMLDGGAQSLANLTAEAESLGGTITGPQAQALATMNDDLNSLQTSAKGAATDFIAALAPAISFVSKKLAVLSNMMQGAGELVDKMGLGFVYMAEKLGFVEDGMARLAAQEVLERRAEEVKKLNKELEQTEKVLSGAVNAGFDKGENSNKPAKKNKNTSIAIAKISEEQQKLNSIFANTRTEAESIAIQMAELEKLKPFAKTPEHLDAINRKMKELNVNGVESNNIFLDQFKNGIKDLETDFSNFGDVAKNVITSIADKFVQSNLDQAFNMFGGGGSGNTPSGGIMPSGGGMNLGNAFSSISSFFGDFGGFFSTGGTLKPGQWGIAGENGPEPIFAGNSPMQVTPNGGGQVIVNQYINTPDVRGFSRSQGQIAANAARTIENARRNM